VLIYLIRHGETVYNAEKRYQGKSDIPLSEAGRAGLCPSDFRPDKVYVSPLSRARETAELLFPEAELIAADDLREMDFGAFEGRNYLEMAEDVDYRRWVEGGCVDRCPGGEEDRAAFEERTCACFAALVDAALASGEESLVIVAHGGTQMAVLSRYGVPQREYYTWQSGNGLGHILSTDRWKTEEILELTGSFGQ